MKTSILICATCLIVAQGCTGQLRFPSLSSALSSLTGFGSSSSSSSASGSGSAAGSAGSQPSSPYSGLVRDYGRNLMMAMSNIYPTLFKPPQQPQSAQPMAQSPGGPQSPFDNAFGASQFGSSLYSGQAPSFSFGGSTFSISPSLPFGSLGQSSGPQGQASGGPSASASHQSPFAASFGSSINSPSSFGPLSSSPFLQQQMPSFAPATSYSAAFEAANGGPAGSFGAMSSGPLGQGLSQSQAALMGAGSSQGPMGSASAYAPQLSAYQHDQMQPGLHQQQQQQPQHSLQQQQQQQQQQQVQQAQVGQQVQHQQQVAAQFGAQSPGQQHQAAPQVGQYQAAGQQYPRPDVMSLAASAPASSSSSYSNYASIPSAPSSQQAPASPSSYQQPSYR